jgi:predicted  nucleic acid-binding Zn-ribbon protein
MPVMTALLALHQTERQIRALRSRVESAEIYLTVQKRKQSDITQRQEELTTRRKQRQAHIGTLETEVGSVEERLNKLRENLNSATSTKEYHGLLHEVNAQKDIKRGLDDQALKEMTEIENIDSELTSLEEQLAERKTVLKKAKAELKERTAEVAERLSELETERDQRRADVDGSVLDRYELLLEDLDGDVMAEVREMDRKRREYACGECSVHLPFDQVNRITGNADEVLQCETCMRILFVTEAFREELVTK